MTQHSLESFNNHFFEPSMKLFSLIIMLCAFSL